MIGVAHIVDVLLQHQTVDDPVVVRCRCGKLIASQEDDCESVRIAWAVHQAEVLSSALFAPRMELDANWVQQAAEAIEGMRPNMQMHDRVTFQRGNDKATLFYNELGKLVLRIGGGDE